jgi:hypothetical protein
MAATALALAACQGTTAPAAEEKVMNFTLTSTAFKNDERIPKKYSGEGDDVSPPLEWSEPPVATKAFALICDDPDAPRGTWNHWTLWNLPAELRKLPENVAKTETVADLGGARQGRNSGGVIGYSGPKPPPGHGTHHYHFHLYALAAPLDLKAGADRKAVEAALKGHVIGQATVLGTYSR